MVTGKLSGKPDEKVGREGVGGCLVISLIRIGFTAHDFTSVFPRLKTFLRMRGNDEQHQFFLSLKGVSKYISPQMMVSSISRRPKY